MTDGARQGGDDILEQGDSGRFRGPGWGFLTPGWRPSRGASVLAAVTLLAGLAVGYVAGQRHALGGATPAPSRTAAAPAPSAGSSVSGVPESCTQSASNVSCVSSAQGAAGVLSGAGPLLTQAFPTCAVQKGRELQLGIEVVNQSPSAIQLGNIHTGLPLGGLRPIAQQWAPCGTLPLPQGISVSASSGSVVPAGWTALAPGESTWLSVTFQVLRRCPAPLPVLFSVGYASGAQNNGTQDGVVQFPGFPDLSQVPYSGCKAGGGVTGS